MMFSIGFSWDNSRYAIALLSVSKHNLYKICELVESEYFGENELEWQITQALRRNYVNQGETLVKITNSIVGQEVFKENRYGYRVVDFNPDEDIQRLNLKFQNDEIVVNPLISSLVTKKLANCTDFNSTNLCIQAMAIALKDFSYSHDLPISVPRPTRGGGWLNFQF